MIFSYEAYHMKAIVYIITSCWSSDTQNHPTFKEIFIKKKKKKKKKKNISLLLLVLFNLN